MTIHHYLIHHTWRSVKPENLKNLESWILYPQVQLRKPSNTMVGLILIRTHPRKGSPRVTSTAEDKFIRVTSLRDCKLTAPQIRACKNASQSSSSRHSTSTVQRRLCESDLHGWIAAKMLRKNKKNRSAWAKKHNEYILDQWKSVLYIDISGSTHCVFLRWRKGERMVCTLVVPILKHGG